MELWSFYGEGINIPTYEDLCERGYHPTKKKPYYVKMKRDNYLIERIRASLGDNRHGVLGE